MSNPWIRAARLRTLPLGLSTILVGFSLVNFKTPLNPVLFISVLCVSILLQILSNYANDYGDFTKGTDTAANRSDRMLSSALIQPQTMKKALWGLSFLILSLGIFTLAWSYYILHLSVAHLISLLFLGILSILASVFYTIGKNAYGYHGFGDLGVLLFFGLVPVMGIQWLCGVDVSWTSCIGGLGVGLLSVSVLNTNNYRDLDQDKLAGKKTLAVILGEKRTLHYQRILLVLGFSGLFVSFALPLNYLLNFNGSNHYIEMFLLFGVFSPSAVFLSRYYAEMKSMRPGDREGLNLTLKHISLSVLLLCVAHFGLSFYLNSLFR